MSSSPGKSSEETSKGPDSVTNPIPEQLHILVDEIANDTPGEQLRKRVSPVGGGRIKMNVRAKFLETMKSSARVVPRGNDNGAMDAPVAQDIEGKFSVLQGTFRKWFEDNGGSRDAVSLQSLRVEFEISRTTDQDQRREAFFEQFGRTFRTQLVRTSAQNDDRIGLRCRQSEFDGRTRWPSSLPEQGPKLEGL